MPMHDWTTVYAGEFHAFHNAWIGELQRALNSGILPGDYYALGEQRAGAPNNVAELAKSSGSAVPEFLRIPLPALTGVGSSPARSASEGGKVIAVADRPPQARIMQQAPEESLYYLSKQRAVVIRHVTGDRVVAIIEIVSSGNKQARVFFEQLVNKALAALAQGRHLLIVDPFPPGAQDPQGIHGKVWESLTGETFELASPQSRTIVSYCAALPPTAYVELPNVGDDLPEMPLFLSADEYVRVPLEETYQAAWTSMPSHLRHALETR